MERTKAYRRATEKKAKAKTVKKMKINQVMLDLPKEALDPTAVGVNASCHSSRCSCVSCGNPRRKAKGKEKLTKQERVADELNESMSADEFNGVMADAARFEAMTGELADFIFSVAAIGKQLKDKQDDIKARYPDLAQMVAIAFIDDGVFEAMYNLPMIKSFREDTGIRMF